MVNVTVDEIQRNPLKYVRQVEAGETLVNLDEVSIWEAIVK
jgi:antitoxin (DNA-binding transcriptional repressor) of toxin-antitoxin stability system